MSIFDTTFKPELFLVLLCIVVMFVGAGTASLGVVDIGTTIFQIGFLSIIICCALMAIFLIIDVIMD